MPTYKVTLIETTYAYAVVELEAEGPDDACDKAYAMREDLDFDPTDYGDNVDIEEVEELPPKGIEMILPRFW